MSRTKSHLVRSLRTGATTAAAAVSVATLAGVAAFVLTAPGTPHVEAVDIEPLVLVDRLAAAPDFVAPTPTSTPTPTPVPEPPPAAVPIRAAITGIQPPDERPSGQARNTAPAPVATYDRSSIVEAIYAVWPPHLAPTAVVIAECESSMDPTAVNPSSGAAGLFQALGHGPVPADPYGQSVQALNIYTEQGSWRPWNASIHCWG